MEYLEIGLKHLSGLGIHFLKDPSYGSGGGTGNLGPLLYQTSTTVVESQVDEVHVLCLDVGMDVVASVILGLLDLERVVLAGLLRPDGEGSSVELLSGFFDDVDQAGGGDLLAHTL